MAELAYTPRKQFIGFHQRVERWAALLCHRRAGKSVAAVHELLIRALYSPKHNARYAYVAPFYRQAKEIAWVYLKEAAREFVASQADIRESELRVRLINGAWITLYGGDNVDALRGIYLDGVVLDEFQDCKPSLWGLVILPTLSDRKGWAVFLGTPKGKNHFYRVCEKAKKTDGWFYTELRADSSGIIDPRELLELQAIMTPEQFRAEMLCSFTAAMEGCFYAEQLERMEADGRIRDDSYLYAPDQDVHVATDLGYTDSTAFWFWQHRPDGIAIIDFYENSTKELAHYLEYLHAKPYSYGTVWLPHDARAKTLQTGRSTIEQASDFFKKHRPDTHLAITPSLSKQHGIDAARLVLNHCVFDRLKCGDGIESLREFRGKHSDGNSDPADAFRYLSLVAKTQLNLTDPAKKLKDVGVASYGEAESGLLLPYSLNDLHRDREAPRPGRFARLRVA